MRLILTIAALAMALFAEAQDREVQLSGRLIGGYSDTTKVTVWSDGQLIGEDAITHRHYALILGEHEHYTILFRNGDKEKYCHVLLVNMELEHIQVDVHFGSTASVVIYKHKRNARQYTHLQYSTRGFILREFNTIETE